MLKWTFTSFIRIKSVKISKVCKLFQFPKNALILTDKQNMCDIYMYYESKSAEDSYRQNFLSFYLLYLFKSNGLKKKKLFLFRFIYLFLAALGFPCCAHVFSSFSEPRPLWRSAGASHCSGFCCGARALSAWASVAVAHKLSCSMACGILPDQGSNPCPLHW